NWLDCPRADGFGKAYLFLVLAADRQGVSYCHHDRICSTLEMTLDEYLLARDSLIANDLIEQGRDGQHAVGRGLIDPGGTVRPLDRMGPWRRDWAVAARGTRAFLLLETVARAACVGRWTVVACDSPPVGFASGRVLL
ncbi:MAG: hypothetical protein JW940_16130, partial [Polyangiaceae bacterium]|nr:hypothetical protein [Polyangiaceae bacterium]